MNQSDAPPRRRKLWKFLLSAFTVFLVALAGLAWYATTDTFQSWVRQRFVSELERISGGRVEVGGLHTIPFRLQVDVRDLTIHGREAPDQIPLLHADRVVARVKIISTLGAQVGFHSLILDHPVVHVIVYPDGTTNQPEPKVKASGMDGIEQLFALRIGHFEINRGQLIWNDQVIPIDLQAADLSANADYALFRRRYNVQVSVGKIDTKYADYRSVAWKGEAQLSLERHELQVRSFSAISGRSHIQASGSISNFNQPQFVGQYELTLDLAEVAPILRYPELHRGLLQVSGQGSWSKQSFASNGKLLLSDLEWRDKSFILRSSAVNTEFKADPQRLSLSAFQANVFGGEVRGDADIFNWLNPTHVPDQQKGTIRLKLKDLSVRELATAIPSLRVLRQVDLTGYASGTLDTRWKNSPRHAESEIALDVSPPSQSRAGQLPFRAHARATYRVATEELEVSEFNASTRGTQLRASGTLSRRAALRVSATSDDLSEWEGILAMFEFRSTKSVAMHGSASFNGTANGQLSNLNLAGHVQLGNFKIQLPAVVTTAGEQIAGDSLAADIQLSPRNVVLQHGRLHSGNSTLNFHLSAALDDWQFTPDDSFSAHLGTQDALATDILNVVGLPYPVTGMLNAAFDATGTRARPQGEGSLHLSNATIHDKPVQRLDSRFSLLGSELSLQDLHITYRDADVAGSGTYDLSSRTFRLDLTGHNFDLASIPALQAGPLPLEGRMDFDARTSGTPETPIINATVHLRDLFLVHQHLGNYTFSATTQGADLQLHGRSEFKETELNIDGDVRMREQWPAKLDLQFNHLDVSPLLHIYLGAYVTGSSEAAGEMQLRGPLLNPRELHVTSNISDLFADLEHTQIRNNGPIRVTLANEVVTVQQLRLVGEGTDLTVGGTANLAGDQELALHANGHADLALLHSFNPDFAASGAIAVNVGLGGTISQPSWEGDLQIAAGSIQYSDLPSALSDINGKLVFNPDRLQIEKLQARVGGGTVTFGGYANAFHRQLNFDLTLTGHDVRLRYPQGVSSMTDAQLRWSGTSAASTISGDATLTKLAIAPGFDFGSYLVRSAQTVALPQTNPLLGRISLDVHIVTTPELQMQTAALRLSGDADLRLRGSAAKPVLLGRADVIEGQIYFNGAKYRLERGDITFTNPVTTTPFLDLQASTRVRDYDITLTLNGQIDKMKLSYRSEPPLPQADIVSLLAVGQTQEQYSQAQQAGQSPFLNQASSTVLAEAINNALSNRSQRLFGISHIKVDPQGLNTETSPVQPTPIPAVTIEQQVKENITLTYTTNVAQTSQQIIQGEYNITRDVMIVGIRDYNGVVSFEVRLRQRKR